MNYCISELSKINEINIEDFNKSQLANEILSEVPSEESVPDYYEARSIDEILKEEFEDMKYAAEQEKAILERIEGTNDIEL